MKLEKIREIVENSTKLNIKVKTRKRELVYSRAVFFKLAKAHTRESLSSIGKSVKKDHATVLHGIKVFDEQISVYKDTQEYLKIFERIDNIIRKANSTREKDRSPGTYYRRKYANTLLALREELRNNRLLKEQLVNRG